MVDSVLRRLFRPRGLQVLSARPDGGTLPCAPAIAGRGRVPPGRTLFDYVPVLLVSVSLHYALWQWWVHRPNPVSSARPAPMIEVALVAASLPQVAAPAIEQPPPAPREVKREAVLENAVAPSAPKRPAPKPMKKPQPRPAPTTAIAQLAAPAATAPQAPRAAPLVTAAAEPPTQTETEAIFNADYLRNPKPVYPAIATRRGWQGRVLLRVRVLENGTCERVEVQQSSGHDVFDESAVQAVQRWRFVPAKRGAIPIASWVAVPIVFKLNT